MMVQQNVQGEDLIKWEYLKLKPVLQVICFATTFKYIPKYCRGFYTFLI